MWRIGEPAIRVLLPADRLSGNNYEQVVRYHMRILLYQAVDFGTGLRAVILCDWKVKAGLEESNDSLHRRVYIYDDYVGITCL